MNWRKKAWISLLLGVFVGTAAAQTQTAPTKPNYEALARQVITDFSSGKYDAVEARFGPQLAAALPLEKLPLAWKSALAQFGDFVSIESVRSEVMQGYTVEHVVCKFSRTEAEFIMPFSADGMLAGFRGVLVAADWTAPPYAKPDSFEERPVTVKTGRFELPGFLTLPKTGGPFPAVVLVHGSGPNDMDESLGPNRTFKDLAYGLASRGVAVLRYEKRTHKYGAQSSDDPTTFTVKDEEMDDSRSAVAMLATMPQIDPKRIFVAGHSEGGYLAPRIATGDSQIAGIILLEGNERPLDELIVEQVHYEASLSGPITPQTQTVIDQAEDAAKQLRNPDLKIGMTVNVLGASLPASYVLDLRAYHPADVAAALKIPILIVQGGRDYQVTMTDFADWQKALAGHTNVTYKTYPAINHLLMPGTGPASPAEYSKPNHVEQGVVEDIAAWVQLPQPRK